MQNAKVKKLMRKDKEKFINEKCRHIEEKSITNSLKDLYQGVKSLTRKFNPRIDTVKADDGALLCESDEVKQRWKQYCCKLYKKNETSFERVPTSSCDNMVEPAPFYSEVKQAISELKNNKSPGIDEVVAELTKNGGNQLITFFHKLCIAIWMKKEWPVDWVNSIFVPIPKRGDVLQCNNNRTIALISHCSKILLKIISNRMKPQMDVEINETRAGFRSGTGTRNQILNLKLIIEKNREFGNDIFLCFIDYSKAFDMVSHEILWITMKRMGFSLHIIDLIRSLYSKQKAAVRTTHGLTDWFDIEQGVRQGCILSPHLFNIYSEQIMRNALEDFTGGVRIGGRVITNLRYANDVVLIAGGMEELQELVDRVSKASSQFGLSLNPSKTKVMKICRKPSNDEELHFITVNNKRLENVKEFIYLGSLITNNCDDTKEIRRRLCIAKTAMISLPQIWKDKGISTGTKKRLLWSLVFSIASYGSECWVLKKSDEKKIEAFEMWCYRRLLRISWTDMKSNEWVLEKIDCKERLLTAINRRKMSFVGHILRHKDISCDLFMGSVYGHRGRGRPKTRYSDNIKDRAGNRSIVAIYRLAQDRNKWRATAVNCVPSV